MRATCDQCPPCVRLGCNTHEEVTGPAMKKRQLDVRQRLAAIDARMNHDGFQNRLGMCYVIAGQKVVDSPGAFIVHGSIELVGSPIDHAWAVLESPEGGPGMVYEPATDALWSQEEFDAIFMGRERVRYPREEFMAILLSVCHWGPYDAMAKEKTNFYDREAVDDARAEMR